MLTKIKTSVIVSLVLTLLFSFWTSSAVEINPDTIADLTLTREFSSTKILLDEEITITYKIQPKPIQASVVTPPDKEIYLVMDTSGSMDYNLGGKKRIQVAREAANKFLDKLKGKENVKVGLITYSDIGAVKRQLTSNLQLVKDSINSINVVGGTNIGDGLRLGYYRLKKSGNSNADKYLILLTDGEPTYHSTEKKYPYNYYFGEDTAPHFRGGGSYAWEQDIEYCYLVAQNYLKQSNIKSYMIAFTEGSNANVLNEVAQKAGGVYKQALTSNALDNVYNEIYEEIAVDFSVENVKFEEKFPEGLTVVSAPEGFNVNGQVVTGNLPDIRYEYNSSNANFEANPIEFSIKLKGTKKGSYFLNASKLSYKDFDNTNKTVNFSNKTVEVVALQAKFDVGRSLSQEEMLVNEEFSISYTIVPKEFSIAPGLVPPSQLTVKDVNFSEEFPEGLEVVSAEGFNITGRTVYKNFGDIVYTYDSSTGKYKYTGDPIEFTISLKGQEGEYTLGNFNSSKISYRDLDKQIKEKSFPKLYPRIVKFGNPKLEVLKVNRRGEVVDVTIKVTLPKRTDYGQVRIPVVQEDGTLVKDREHGELVKTIEGKDEVYTEQFVYENLSIYKTHRLWLWAVSDFDENTANETDIITIFEGININ